ncbi:MAG TPA: AlpA family phage regulatory protein [Burkholderiales bacterium]|jgi:prophage regulatory protein|nr:AlpA family phage regulatory protein [Burkholderiales bacterium]
MKIVVRKTELESVIGFGEGTARRLERKGLFPRRRQLTNGSVGWLASELEEWAKSRPIAEGGMRGEAPRLKRKAEASG